MTNSINISVSAPRYYVLHLILSSYDYNMHVEGLLPVKMCLVTLLSSEQCLQFEKLHT